MENKFPFLHFFFKPNNEMWEKYFSRIFFLFLVILKWSSSVRVGGCHPFTVVKKVGFQRWNTAILLVNYFS